MKDKKQKMYDLWDSVGVGINAMIRLMDEDDTLESEQYDIAKERWMVYRGFRGLEVRQICDGHEPTLAEMSKGATSVQAALMAAAPELADMLREFLENPTLPHGVGSDIIDKAVHKLCELGIPNVAPWYKDE